MSEYDIHVDMMPSSARYRSIAVYESNDQTLRDSVIARGNIIETRPLLCTYARHTDGENTFFASLAGHEAPHLIIKSGSDFQLIMLTAEPALTAKVLIRLIREITLRTCESEGGIFAHAAAVASQDKGLLIIGESGAGKTTLSGELSRNASYELIANDRALLTKSGENVSASRWPIYVRVSADQIRHWGLNVQISQLRRYKAAENSGDSRIDNWPANKKIELTPLEYAQFLGAKRRQTTPICALLLPKLRLDASFSIKEESPLSRSSLTDTIRTPIDIEFPVDWLSIRGDDFDSKAQIRDTLTSALLSLPTFSLTACPLKLRQHLGTISVFIEKGLSKRSRQNKEITI
ncbi:hypothetical protein [Rhizobium laguerreae]|uniref:hypothetical protein n=1 Tax=Rhizobium laguerreae TaxID=1076926 RepID=UPI001C906E2D|nr:hypothetical protein [Rhizobium laguerreae]MBY3158016.1 hypothetical protein [Rhizobium laguerreae]MBY3447039.1 hypothetical protein [Rhizobium laguerreae]